MGIRVDKKKKEEEEKHFFLQQQREKGKLLKDVFFKVCGSYEGEGIPSAHPSKRNYCHTLKEVWGEIPSWWRVMGRRCPRLESDFKCFFCFGFFVVAYFVIKTQPCHNAARIAPSEKNTRLEAGFSRLRLTWEKNKISIMTLQGLSAASAAACTLYIRRTGAEWPRGLSDMTQTVRALFKIVRSEKKEVRFIFWSELASIDRRLQRNCAQTESPKQQLGSSY